MCNHIYCQKTLTQLNAQMHYILLKTIVRMFVQSLLVVIFTSSGSHLQVHYEVTQQLFFNFEKLFIPLTTRK
jgi:hypothetical protein